MDENADTQKKEQLAMTSLENKKTLDSNKQMSTKMEVTVEQQGDKLPQFAAAFIVTFAHFTSGYAMGWTSPALPLVKNEGYIEITVDQASWVGSLFCVGAALVTPISGMLADRIGRKNTTILGVLPFIVSWSLIAAFPYSTVALYIARLCAGFSAGTMTVVVPMYIAECAEPSVRGALSNMLIVMFNLGLLAAYSVGAVLDSYVTLSLLGLAPVALFMLGALWLPESPALLVTKGRMADARKALRKLRGGRYDVDTELMHMEAAAAEERASAETESLLRLVWRSRGLRRGLGVTLGLMTCQQMCGISAVLTYTSDIFKASGSEMDPNMATVVMGALQFLFTGASCFVLDRAGRRPLMIGSSILMFFSLLGLGCYFEARYANWDVSSLGWLPLATISLYIVFFSGGAGPVPWVLVGEVFPPRARGAGSAMISTWVWGLAFCVTRAFPPLLEAIGLSGAVWLFSIGCLVTAVFAVFFCPETKGKTLDCILRELEGEKPAKTSA